MDSLFNDTTLYDGEEHIKKDVPDYHLDNNTFNEEKPKTYSGIQNHTRINKDEINKLQHHFGNRMYRLDNNPQAYIEAMIEKVCEYSPETVKAYRERLTEKMNEILEDKQISEQRILLEAGIFAEKTAIDEEYLKLVEKFFEEDKESISGMFDILKTQEERQKMLEADERGEINTVYDLTDLCLDIAEG